MVGALRSKTVIASKAHAQWTAAIESRSIRTHGRWPLSLATSTGQGELKIGALSKRGRLQTTSNSVNQWLPLEEALLETSRLSSSQETFAFANRLSSMIAVAVANGLCETVNGIAAFAFVYPRKKLYRDIRKIGNQRFGSCECDSYVAVRHKNRLYC
jgi:hypothetical protein